MLYKSRLAAFACAWWILSFVALATGCGSESVPSVVPAPVPTKARPLPRAAIGSPSPIIAATAALIPGDMSVPLWRSVARRVALLTLSTKGGDVLLGYDAMSRQFVRISDAMPHVIAAAVLTSADSSNVPTVYYLRAPGEGVVVGRIVLATGVRDEISLGQVGQVVVGAVVANANGGTVADALEAGLWISRTVGRQMRTATPQWAPRALVEQPKNAHPKETSARPLQPHSTAQSAQINTPPMWVMQWGAIDVVEILRQGGQALADVDVDWDQWGTASALQLRGLARALPMTKFVDARGIAWSHGGRWLLYRQWSEEVCDPVAKASLEIFDTLTATTTHVGELAPDGGFGWLGVATLFFEAPQGGRLVMLATTSDVNGNSPTPQELGLWPQLRWPVRWRAPDCTAVAGATAQ